MTDQKVAIVTGSSRGIGADIAKRLAKDGFAVVVNYAGSEKEAAKVVQTITSAGGKAVSVQANVADPADVQRLFEQALSTFGGVDVLINNAGVMAVSKIGETDDEAFNRQMDINVRGTFNTMREASRHLRDGGRVINFSSSAIALRLPGYGTYVATKAAVDALTVIFSQEMRGRHITVNAVAPGPVETELFMTGKTPEIVERLSKAAPLERLGQPNDIANVVSFLSGPDGGWINGQVLRANGGIA